MANTVTGFVKRVLALVKGGDEGKIQRFQQKAQKFCNRQIKMNKDEIENVNEQIADAKERYDDALVSVNMDAIKTTEGVNDYVPDYLLNLSQIQDSIQSLEDTKDKLQEQISKYEALSASLD